MHAFNLRDLEDLHLVPRGTYFCQGTARSRIDTVACHSEVQSTIGSFHYRGSTLLSDHHVSVLFTVAHPVVPLDKPSPHPVSRTPEYHLVPMALSPADTADFQSSVLRTTDVDPPFAPSRWQKGLQRAIYDWAYTAGRVWALRFRDYRLRARPTERAPLLKSPEPPFPARSTHPSVGCFTATAQNFLGNCVALGHALKRSLVVLREAQRQQSFQDIKRRAPRRTKETHTLLRTAECWRVVQRHSRGPPRDISEIPLDNKTLLNAKETLCALHASRIRLKGHIYRTRDDPEWWAPFKLYLDLLPQHAPWAREASVQPRHLSKVQSE